MWEGGAGAAAASGVWVRGPWQGRVFSVRTFNGPRTLTNSYPPVPHIYTHSQEPADTLGVYSRRHGWMGVQLRQRH